MSEKPYIPPHAERTHDLDTAAHWAARKKILIVDDDVAFADMTRLFLEESGYEVEVASDGVQGIKKIMVNDYSVIICDMVMPNLAGDMFYLGVQRLKPHLTKRFLFMTGHHKDPKVDEFIKRVRGLILFKPFQLHVLMETIKAVEQKNAAA